MDRMGCKTGVVDYETDGTVRAEVVDVPLGVGWVGVISSVRGELAFVYIMSNLLDLQVGEEKNRVIVVCTKTYVIHCPLPITTRVLAKAYIDFLHSWCCCEWCNR